MHGLFKNVGRDYSVRFVGGVITRRRWKSMALGGVVSASLLITFNAVFAELTTIHLSPLVSKSTLVAPLAENRQIGVVLALPSSDPVGLKAFIQHVSTPGDSLYRKYITPQEFAEKFGGDASDYQSLKVWAAGQGLVISQESISRTTLTVRGSVKTFSTLFKTQLNTYRTTDGAIFYSASVSPTVPSEIAAKVTGIIGLTTGKALAPMAKVAKVLGEKPAANAALRPAIKTDNYGTGPGGTYSPKDLQTAYETPKWGKLELGLTVALFEQGYYNPNDVKFYFKTFGIGTNTIQTAVGVDGSPLLNEKAIELEACLDNDMLVALNPDIAEVITYVDDYNWDPFPVAMVDAFQAVANDNKAQILSVSYGEDEGYFGSDAETAEDTVLQQLAAQGITVFASSGDDGAFGNYYNYPYNVSDPASDPYVTGVGGTTLLTGFNGQYENEVVWNEFPNFGATGGGISTFWPLPAYQQLSGTFYVTANGGSATFRNVPDIAAVGDPLTGVGVYVSDQGGWFQVGGTSVACPIWAGYLSNLNAAFNWSGLGRLGFFNPTLYAIGNNYPAGYLNDIYVGSNGFYGLGGPGYGNGFGYSNTTGSGSIWGGGFALQVLISGKQAGTPPGAFKVIAAANPKATSATIKWTPSTGASGYAIGLYHSGSYGRNVANAFVEPPTATKLTFKGLTPNTPYTIYMWGYNASGGSPYAKTSFTTAQATATPTPTP